MFRKTSILKQNEWSRYPRFAKHKMQFYSTKCNFTPHHIITSHQHVELGHRMDKANADLYRQAIEIKKLRLKCDSSLETCKCLVMIDTDVTTVIACAFYQLTTLVFIEVICVKTLHQGHGQAIMKHIISTYQTLQIHLISLDCVIKFTTR